MNNAMNAEQNSERVLGITPFIPRLSKKCHCETIPVPSRRRGNTEGEAISEIATGFALAMTVRPF